MQGLSACSATEAKGVMCLFWLQVFPSQPLAFVVAMADDKDHGGFLSGLVAASPMAVVFTRVPIVGSQIRWAMECGHFPVDAGSSGQ